MLRTRVLSCWKRIFFLAKCGRFSGKIRLNWHNIRHCRVSYLTRRFYVVNRDYPTCVPENFRGINRFFPEVIILRQRSRGLVKKSKVVKLSWRIGLFKHANPWNCWYDLKKKTFFDEYNRQKIFISYRLGFSCRELYLNVPICVGTSAYLS